MTRLRDCQSEDFGLIPARLAHNIGDMFVMDALMKSMLCALGGRSCGEPMQGRRFQGEHRVDMIPIWKG